MTEDTLVLEAKAFDEQIAERLEAGFVPDLRRAGACEYFYNNTWRHPDFVELDFVEQFQIIRTALETHAAGSCSPLKVLEVGCGPGHISLELARSGFDVTGIDLSIRCIEAAEKTACEDPWKKDRGPLCYLTGDFNHHSQFDGIFFDAVLFVGALHHFPEQNEVAQVVSRILAQDGLILAHEPTRDRMTKGNAAFIHLVRLLLSQHKGFYKDMAIPENPEGYREEVEHIFAEMRYEGSSGEKKQSVNDNEAGYAEMISALDTHFHRLQFQERYAFFHEMIGGLRFDAQKNKALARYLRDADRELCRLGVLQPTEFFYVGRKMDH